MAAPSPRVLETDTSAPSVDENNNNNSNQSPRVVNTTTTTTTTVDRLRNRLRTNPVRNQSQNELATKSVRNSGRSRQVRTNAVRLQSITEENLPHTTGTTIRKSFKKGTLNGKITSYDKKREYYMIEYEDRDSEELRHKTNTAIDQLKRLTRSRLQAKTAVQNNNNNQPKMESTTNNKLPPHHAMAVFDETTGKVLEYRHLIKHKDPKIRKKWQLPGANEFGRTMQGVGKTRSKEDKIEGIDTMHLIKKCDIPKNKKITYARFCSDARPQKSETHRTRLTAGGDRLDYEGKTSTDTAGLETIKIHINSTISRKEAKYMCIDIGNMYLNTKLLSPEYIWIHIDLIPEEIQHEYNTKEFTDKDGYVYMEVTGGIYGLFTKWISC
jgi:hypothetical protein